MIKEKLEIKEIIKNMKKGDIAQINNHQIQARDNLLCGKCYFRHMGCNELRMWEICAKNHLVYVKLDTHKWEEKDIKSLAVCNIEGPFKKPKKMYLILSDLRSNPVKYVGDDGKEHSCSQYKAFTKVKRDKKQLLKLLFEANYKLSDVEAMLK